MGVEQGMDANLHSDEVVATNEPRRTEAENRACGRTALTRDEMFQAAWPEAFDGNGTFTGYRWDTGEEIKR